MSDDITAVSYVNKGRIKSVVCNEIAKELWVHDKICCTLQNVWVSAAHIPGTQNIEAESFSRNINKTIKWKLSTHLFQNLSRISGKPTIDLFASHINHQIDKYISWKPDPKALASDDFSIKRNSEFCYYFPPFSLLGKVAAKIYRDKTKAVVIIPKWPTQHWYHSLLRKAARSMIITPSTKSLAQPQDS